MVHKDFKLALNWAPMMLRDVGLSDNYNFPIEVVFLGRMSGDERAHSNSTIKAHICLELKYVVSLIDHNIP